MLERCCEDEDTVQRAALSSCLVQHVLLTVAVELPPEIPMPWMLPILMHISSTFGIDNINLKLMKLNEKVSNVAKHM